MFIQDRARLKADISNLLVFTINRLVLHVRTKGTGPHRVTGPESTAWLLPLTGTVVGDVSANNRASNVAAWPCETCGVRGRGGCLIVRRFDSPKVSCIG